jgi:hypothetical protein
MTNLEITGKVQSEAGSGSTLPLPSTNRSGMLDNVLTMVATGLLLTTLVWRLALTFLPAPTRVHELLSSTADAGAKGQAMLLVETPDTGSVDHFAMRVRESWPELPLEVRALRVPPDASQAADRDAKRLHALVQAYGYSRLPLLLVFDKQGHVVRITPLQ